jgi:transposase
MTKVHLNQFTKGQIIGLWKAKLAKKAISKNLNIPRATVQRIIKNYSEAGEAGLKRKKGSGRQKKTSKKEDKKIIKTTLQNRTLTSNEIKKNYNYVFALELYEIA